MAGITDSPFRQLARRFGAGLVYTECISAEGVRRLGKKSLELCSFREHERPLAVQLFGSDVDQFADAAAIVADKFHPDLIDINCGCPVKKFVTRGCGGALMQDPDQIGLIVEKVRTISQVPVSVKLRAGYFPSEETAPQAATAAEQAGVAVVAIHGRYVRKAKGVSANWDVIGRVKSAVKKTPVIGNGDIFSYHIAREMKLRTGCDRVMLARWAQGAPWVFEPFRDGTYPEEEVLPPAPAKKIDILLDHYNLMLNIYDEKTAVYKMRKQIGWYLSGIVGIAKLRQEIMKLISINDVFILLNSFKSQFIT